MKKLFVFVILLGVVLAGGVWWIGQRRASEANGAAYTEVPVEFGRLTETVSATAVLQAPRVYSVGTEASGKVVEVAADFNQVVEEGAVLLRLDDRMPRQKRDQAAVAVDAARAGLRQTEAARDTARTLLERERMRDPLVRRAIEVELAENQLRAAEAAVEVARVRIRQAQQELTLAELALQHTIVRAPVLHWSGGTLAPGFGRSGVGALGRDEAHRPRHKFVVLDRKVGLNQMIDPRLAVHLFTLAGDQSVMHVEAQVAEGDIGKVKRGLEADFTVSSYADTDLSFRGRVGEVRALPINDRGAVYYKVIVEVDNERDPATGRWRLTPGLTATVDIVRRVHARTWKMPAMALSFEPEDALVTAAARARVSRWQSRQDAGHWKPVWVVGADRKPWPIFVRIGGVNAAGATGIRDLSFAEVLEWDPDLSPRPEGDKPSTHPQVIIAVPPGKHGLFNPPNLKL